MMDVWPYRSPLRSGTVSVDAFGPENRDKVTVGQTFALLGAGLRRRIPDL